jgi:hypothetical protein
LGIPLCTNSSTQLLCPIPGPSPFPLRFSSQTSADLTRCRSVVSVPLHVALAPKRVACPSNQYPTPYPGQLNIVVPPRVSERILKVDRGLNLVQDFNSTRRFSGKRRECWADCAHAICCRTAGRRAVVDHAWVMLVAWVGLGYPERLWW